jgi:hypothetical protein
MDPEERGVLAAGLAPELVKICRCGDLTAAKIVGETADIRRFRSKHAFDVTYRALLADVTHTTATATNATELGEVA